MISYKYVDFVNPQERELSNVRVAYNCFKDNYFNQYEDVDNYNGLLKLADSDLNQEQSDSVILMINTYKKYLETNDSQYFREAYAILANSRNI